MSTVVGLRCRDGVALAGDRLLVRDGHVASKDRDHVFAFSGVVAAVVGSDVDRFADRLDVELRRYRLERGEVPLAAVERLASEIAASTDTDAVVGARDADGIARIRAVYADGSALSDPVVALGSGATLALGVLETVEPSSISVAEGESTLTDLFETVSERDPKTGSTVDVESLRDES